MCFCGAQKEAPQRVLEVNKEKGNNKRYGNGDLFVIRQYNSCIHYIIVSHKQLRVTQLTPT